MSPAGLAASPYEDERFRRAAGPVLRPGGLELTRRALAVLDLPPGSRVADLGCGAGATTALLGEAGFLATGLDISDALLAEARAGAPGCHFVRARADALPFAPASLDALFCECVLTLLPSPARALEGMRACLRPGGRLVLSDLYLREAGDAPQGRGCLAGAVERGALLGLLHGAGLRPTLFEDHTPHLKTLAARLLLEQGTLEPFLPAGGTGCGCAPASLRRVGYYLAVAVKEDV